MPSKAMLALAALAVTAIGAGALSDIASADEGGDGWRGRHEELVKDKSTLKNQVGRWKQFEQFH